MLIVAGCAVYAWGWRRHELPAIVSSWPVFACDLRGALLRMLSPAEVPTFVALGAIMLVGTLLRLRYLFQPIRYDEAFTLFNFAAVPLTVGLSTYYAPNNHLLHTLLLHFTQLAFGTDEWALRVPALIAGILVIPATYGAIRLVYGPDAGLLASALVASSAVFVEFSTNARGYTLLSLIVLLLVALAAHVKRHWTPAGLCVFGILAALGFFTIPVMLYPWGALLVWLTLSEAPPWPRVASLIPAAVLTLMLTLLLYTPVLVKTGLQLLMLNRFVEPRPWSDFIAEWPAAAASVWRDWMRHLPLEVQAVLGVGFLVSLVWYRQRLWHGLPLPLAAVIWIVPVVVIQRVVPFERVWLFLLPLYAGAACAGVLQVIEPVLARLARIRSALVSLGAVCLAVTLAGRVAALQPVPIGDAQAATDFLRGYLRPGDEVVAAPPMDWPLRYYFKRYGLTEQYLPFVFDSAGPLIAPKRRIVVVDQSNGQTLAAVADSAGLTNVDATQPLLVWRYDTTALYDVTTGRSQ